MYNEKQVASRRRLISLPHTAYTLNPGASQWRSLLRLAVQAVMAAEQGALDESASSG